MVNVRDVTADAFINAYAQHLKRSGQSPLLPISTRHRALVISWCAPRHGARGSERLGVCWRHRVRAPWTASAASVDAPAKLIPTVDISVGACTEACQRLAWHVPWPTHTPSNRHALRPDPLRFPPDRTTSTIAPTACR